jgi:CBS domain-containing protein
MKVSEVMTHSVDFVAPTATVQEAATQMAELDVGAVLIGGGDDGVVGILTDRDILMRVVVEGQNPAYLAVSEVMSSEVTGCRDDEPIEAAFATMRERQFRRMPVFDEHGTALGVVTLSDLAKHIESPEKLAESLRELSEPHRRRTVGKDTESAESGASA